MHVTTARIKEYWDYWRGKVLTKDIDIIRFERENAENDEIQRDYLSEYSTICDVGNLSQFDHNIDMKKLKAIMGDNFYDYNVMKAVACSVYSVFYGISAETGNIARRNYLKESIENLHKFGSDSAFGHALTGEIQGAKDMYVIKVPKSKQHENDALHELFVGLRLNELRRYVPNFAFVYGGIGCSPPIIDPENKNGKVLTFCDGTESRLPYIVYESITPSEPFDVYVKKGHVDQFLSVYFQYLLALDLASEKLRFTHYDCHPGNILARKIKVEGIEGNFCIPYRSSKSKDVIYVVSDVVATAIDYGQSTIGFKGRDIGYGDVRIRQAGVVKGPWPMHDAYKLLMFTAFDLMEEDSKKPVKQYGHLLNVMNDIFRFFNKTEPFDKCLKEQRDNLFILPMFDDNRDVTIMELINYIQSVYDTSNVLLDKPNFPVLECTWCYTFAKVEKDAYRTQHSPRDLFEFYDIATHLGKAVSDQYDDLVNNFNYEKAAADYMLKVKKTLEDLKKYVNLAKQPTITGNIANNKTMNSLMMANKYLIVAVSKYQDLEIWFEVGMSVAILYQDNELQKFINDGINELKNFKNMVLFEIKAANKNYEKIREITSKPSWAVNKLLYPWYTTSADEVVGLKLRFERDQSKAFRAERLPSYNPILLSTIPSAKIATKSLKPGVLKSKAPIKSMKPIKSLMTQGTIIEEAPRGANIVSGISVSRQTSVLSEKRSVTLDRLQDGTVRGINVAGRIN